MNVGKVVRQRLVEAPGSVGERARQRRWEAVRTYFPDLSEMDVVDLGGRVGTWLQAPVRPRSVHVVNLERQQPTGLDWLTSEHADACELPQPLRGRRFDVVFSNSVLEHVGGHDRQASFAASVRSLAPYHWVQTPYRYFPLEPHWLFPGMQFLPLRARSAIAHHWPLVNTQPRSREEAIRDALAVDLVSITAMRHYFPESHIHHERVGGLTKSIVAVRATAVGRPVDHPTSLAVA